MRTARTRRDSQIPPGRKLLYYGGGALCVLGIALFVSNFFAGPELRDGPSLGDPDFGKRIQENSRKFREGMESSKTRALVGMGFIVVGGVLAGIGRRGAAGSGLVLDPQRARKDLEPWNRAAGGMVDDALSEVDLAKKIGEGLGNPTVKIRCRKCQALSDETAKFCGQCGAPL